VPPALVGLLATHPEQQALDLQYAAPVLAVLFIAAARGLGRAGGMTRLRQSRIPSVALPLALALCGLLLSGAGYLRRGPYPPGGAYAGWRFRDNGDGAALTRLARLIPNDAPVSAQTGLLSHLSQRRAAWEFPRLEGAPYVVVQDAGIVSQQSLDTYGGYNAVRTALPLLGYVEIAHDHGVHLFHFAGADQ
jgi:hypothetical protein